MSLPPLPPHVAMIGDTPAASGFAATLRRAGVAVDTIFRTGKLSKRIAAAFDNGAWSVVLDTGRIIWAQRFNRPAADQPLDEIASYILWLEDDYDDSDGPEWARGQ